MARKKKSPSHKIEISDRARTRASTLTGDELAMHLDTLLNRTLPEAYSIWKQGLAPAQEVEMALEATLCIWDELATREDTV